jgi:hypothetical protein
MIVDIAQGSGISEDAADVVELEIGVSFNLNNANMRSQARGRDRWLSRGFGGDNGIRTLLA